MKKSMYQTNRAIQWCIRLHLFIVGIAFVSYLALGFFLGPEFFVMDVKEKLRALGADITVLATVVGPPQKPIVTATPICVSGAPRVQLDWADDTGTSSWDIERDSVTLVTGVATSQYSDISVAESTSYSYVVTANGPMFPGTEVSDPVSVTTLDCPSASPATIVLTRFTRKDVTDFRTDLSTSDRTPTFFGVTNIANGIVDILLHSSEVVSARITANAAGYWQWTSPIRLSEGDHVFTVTVTDPNDSTRTSTDSISFEVVDSTDDSDDEKKKKREREEDFSAGTLEQIFTQPQIPFDINLSIRGGINEVMQGESFPLQVQLVVDETFPKDDRKTILVSYSLLDPSGKEAIRLSPEEREFSDSFFSQNIEVPLWFDAVTGYRILVNAEWGKYTVSRELSFSVLPYPVARLDNGGVITYTEVAHTIGWFLLGMVTLFFLWILLFAREYWYFVHSVRRVTERHLERLGFFGQGKGVWG